MKAAASPGITLPFRDRRGRGKAEKEKANQKAYQATVFLLKFCQETHHMACDYISLFETGLCIPCYLKYGYGKEKHGLTQLTTNVCRQISV